jgi:hypothetical protein
MAGVPRWIGIEKQQVKWLVASVGSPPLRQAATTLEAMAGQGTAKQRIINFDNEIYANK